MPYIDYLDRLPAAAWAGIGAVAALVVLLLLARKLRHTRASRWITMLAVGLGLAWSAQGMWDVAVHRYEQAVIVASVLFVVFEAMMVSRMLKAHEYRGDRARRVRHVRAVWVIAVVMALVVALGEGWAQAPARLAIPLLVAYGWWTDLTSDDDPGERTQTSWIYTPHYMGLQWGLLRPGAADIRTIDRDRLVRRITRLAFARKHGAGWADSFLRRDVRLARLALSADDAVLRDAQLRLFRADRVLASIDEWDLPYSVAKAEDVPAPEPPPEPEKTIPTPPEQHPEKPVHVQPDKPADPPTVESATTRAERRAAATLLMRKSITPNRPQGMTAAELAAKLDPPLGLRTAEDIAAKVRAEVRGERINGHEVPAAVVG